MGMFDHVFIDKNLLPISDEEKTLLGDEPGFQSKDLDCEMTEIYITGDGYLEVNKFEYETVPKEERPYPNDDGIRGMIGSLKRVNERKEKIDFHGIFNFYTTINREHWFEFNAKFTDGKLVSITGGKEKY